MFKIGNVEIKNNVVLAPMAGICNSAYRRIIKQMGAGLIYAEMVNDKAIVHENKKTIDMLYMTEEERPISQQIFGSDVDSFVASAKMVYEKMKPDIIDINMGCPVPKVAVSAEAGAALLKNPEKIKEIVSAVVKSVPIPVTVKIRSGWDKNSINAKEVAKICEQAGASAISCLTEPFYFQGADQYLREISAAVQIPVLRKDFTVDEYMIYQAKSLGASAVLLICAILDDGELRAYRQLAKELGLDALVEAHDEYEVDRALNLGAEIVGVNNRDLRTFQVDMNNSIRLRKMAPDNVVFVSESGIRTPEDIRLLYENKVDGVLIGETLMRSPDKKAALESLNGSPLR